MNNIDIENINKELAKREAANYEWKKGGDFTREFIEEKSTDALNEYLKMFKKESEKNSRDEIKRLVDEAFEKYSTDPEDNMIVLGACYYSDESRYAVDVDNPLENINFDGFGHRYNKLAYPIGRDYDLDRWEYGSGQHEGKDQEKYDEMNKTIVQKILSMFDDLGLDNVQDYWEDNNEAINECWYGVHAITKDYQIVTFVIRDDGMLCDEESFERGYNNILIKL